MEIKPLTKVMILYQFDGDESNYYITITSITMTIIITISNYYNNYNYHYYESITI